MSITTNSSGPTYREFGNLLLWSLILGYPLIYSFFEARRGDLGGIAENPLGIYGALALVFALLYAGTLCLIRLVRHWRQGFEFPKIALALLAFYTVYILALFAKGESSSVFGIVLAGLALIAVALTRSSANEILEKVRIFIRVIVAGSLFLAVFVPAVALVPPEENSRALFGLSSRLQGVLSSPSDMGKLASILFLLEITLRTKSPFGRHVFALFAVGATVWSQSRTSIGLIAIAWLIVSIAYRVSVAGRKQIASAFYWVCLGSMTLAPIIAAGLAPRLQHDVVDLTTGRVYVWQGVMDALTSSVVFGLTHERFLQASRLYTHSLDFANAHNQLLESFVMGGVLGAVSLLVFLATLKGALTSRLGTSLTPLALSIGLFGQLAFGTPLRLNGLSWNVATVALIVLCACQPVRALAGGAQSNEGRSVPDGMTPDVPSRGLWLR